MNLEIKRTIKMIKFYSTRLESWRSRQLEYKLNRYYCSFLIEELRMPKEIAELITSFFPTIRKQRKSRIRIRTINDHSLDV